MRRRVLVMTEATYNAIAYALRYLIDSAVDEHGDNGFATVERTRRAANVVERATTRDVRADASAIRDVVDIAVTSACSCLNTNDGHASDCVVRTHRQCLERAVAVANALMGSP